MIASVTMLRGMGIIGKGVPSKGGSKTVEAGGEDKDKLGVVDRVEEKDVMGDEKV